MTIEPLSPVFCMEIVGRYFIVISIYSFSYNIEGIFGQGIKTVL